MGIPKDEPVGTILGPDGKEIASVKKQKQAMGYEAAPRGNPRVSPAWREYNRARDNTEALRFDAEDES